MHTSRPTAVAGLFYPADQSVLQRWLDDALSDTNIPKKAGITAVPRALIAPHAGYIYSGQTAAKAFKLWEAAAQIKTVVIMGPAHRVGFHGMTTIDYDAMDTPLGEVAVDTNLRDALVEKFDFLRYHNMAHAPEHSLEVMLPFIKTVLPQAKVVPLLNGAISAQEVASILEALLQQEGVYVVISSDLSHFHPYAEAQKMDAQTAQWIEAKQWRYLDGEHACGYKGIQGLLAMHGAEHWQVQPIECVNSGDTAGSKDSVVGYGSWAIYENDETARKESDAIE
ncbi:AmmeMemoRadiSam system protein B [Thiomicrorhabdus cannonii]|uniref:AmmeMemoRadiSam system protein B n=1 Tax=Thiomicrorhabdus cannonii TaxID=2748011 RepID=UPI0015BBE09C|nr:AmmeMemoRadiSam system protein B [Thiomicrorhabdus cannonii]